jgi:hypothetical protein
MSLFEAYLFSVREFGSGISPMYMVPWVGSLSLVYVGSLEAPLPRGWFLSTLQNNNHRNNYNILVIEPQMSKPANGTILSYFHLSPFLET